MFNGPKLLMFDQYNLLYINEKEELPVFQWMYQAKNRSFHEIKSANTQSKHAYNVSAYNQYHKIACMAI